MLEVIFLAYYFFTTATNAARVHPTWSTAKHILTQRSDESCSRHSTSADIQYPQLPWIPQIVTSANCAERKTELSFTGQCCHYCRLSGCRILLCVFSKMWGYGVQQPPVSQIPAWRFLPTSSAVGTEQHWQLPSLAYQCKTEEGQGFSGCPF